MPSCEGTAPAPQPPPPRPFPEGSKVETEVFPVYNCVYLGGEIYEWYRVEVTFLNGEPVSEEVIRGPDTRQLDLSKIKYVDLFALDPGETTKIRVDAIRLTL